MSADAAIVRTHDVREGGTWTSAQRRKNDAIFAVIRVAIVLAMALPRAVLFTLGRALGLLAFVILGKERRRARARLAKCFGTDPGFMMTAKAFTTAGTLLADTVTLLDERESPRRGLILAEPSRAVFAAALDEGRGVIFIAAHLGPWERMAALLVAEGFPVATVARESYDPRLTALYERVRAPRGVRSIYRGRPGAVRAIVHELGCGGAVGFLVDLPGRVPSCDVEILGETSPMATGPARIALARRAAVVVGTPSRTETGDAILITRIDTQGLEPGAGGEQLLATRIAHELDRRVRSWPTAWLGLFAPAKLDNAFSASID